MSKDFIVIRADHKEDWSSPQYGPFKCYTMELEETPQGSGITHRAEINQKPTTAPPQPGEQLEGEITPNKNPDFPPRFKKTLRENSFSGDGSRGGGGALKPRDPSEIAGARHAHNLLVAARSFEPLTSVQMADPSLIQGRLDDLEAFACVLDEKTAAISDAAKGAAVVAKESAKAEPDIPF